MSLWALMALLPAAAQPPGDAVIPWKVEASRPALIQDDAAAGVRHRIALSGLLNRHWREGAALATASGLMRLSAQFDREGRPHLIVLAEGAREPWIVAIGLGMRGQWRQGAHAYELRLSYSPFRDKLDNELIIIEDGARQYRLKVGEILAATYRAGAEAGPYRLFYYNEIRALREGPAIDPGLFGFLLVENPEQGRVHRLRREDLAGGSMLRYRIGGRDLYIRWDAALDSLEMEVSDFNFLNFWNLFTRLGSKSSKS